MEQNSSFLREMSLEEPRALSNRIVERANAWPRHADIEVHTIQVSQHVVHVPCELEDGTSFFAALNQINSSAEKKSICDKKESSYYCICDLPYSFTYTYRRSVHAPIAAFGL